MGDLEDFIHEIPQRFERSGKTLHKGRNEIKLIRYNERYLVVKKYRVPNPFNRFAYTFLRKDKAFRSYENAEQLRTLGIDTPGEVAAIHITKNGLFHTGYYISLYNDGLPLTDVLRSETMHYSGSNCRKIADAFVAFTIELHEKGILHKDYNQTNVMYQSLDDGTFRFTLIDINRMKFKKRLSVAQCCRNLKRLGCNMDSFLHISRKYAEMRGWDPIRGLLGPVVSRGIFEKQQKRKEQLKHYLKESPVASYI